MKKIAVLAVQGAFAEHEKIFHRLGAETIQLRQASDLNCSFDALVLPGGESTVQGKLIRELGMFDILQTRISAGLPVFATCAGMILLARSLTNDPTVHLQTLDISVCRNGYGRQLDSFYHVGEFDGLRDVPMSFIRAPRITAAGENVTVISRCNGEITAVRQGGQWAMAFHPELSDDLRCHELFLSRI